MTSHANQASGANRADDDRHLFVTHRIRIPLRELTFTYVRSQGPGGQNVNKVNSKAVMRWAIENSTAIAPDVLARFRAAYASRLTRDGDLVLTSQRYRDQKKNRDDCLEKLRRLLLNVAQSPKQRMATRPSRASVARHKKNKQHNSQKKQMRRAVRDSD